MAHSKSFQQHIPIRIVIELVLFGLLCYAVIAGFSGLHASFLALKSADFVILIPVVIIIAGSYVCAAFTYTFLSPRRLKFGPTLMVQLSGGLVNRLLPGGLGGLGINALYLKKRGMHLATASIVVAVNNMVGFVGNLLLLAIIFLSVSLPRPHIQIPGQGRLLIGACVLVVLVIALLKFTKPAGMHIGLRLRDYARLLASRPQRSFAALLSSMALTSLHVSGLYLILQALHTPASWPIALVAISAGSFIGAAVPTPGGLGGAEAGIAAALISMSINSPAATAAALLYRGVTYWLPLLPGYVALRFVEKNYL